MKIEFDTTSLSALDVKVLTLLAESGSWPIAFPPSVQPADKPDPVKLAPAPKPKKASKPDMNPDADFEAPTPTVEPAVQEPELVETPPAQTSEGTMAEAVAAATQLVSTGGAAKVKEALATVGAKRVSEIAPESIGAFLAALSA